MLAARGPSPATGRECARRPGLALAFVLFKFSFHQAITSGAITVTYRAWKSARVKVGGRYRLNAGGLVAVDEIRETPLAQITDAAARASGFTSRESLLRQLDPPRARGAHDPAATVFEVRFHYLPDPRTPASDVPADVSGDALRGLLGRLRNMDSRSGGESWTGAALALIEANPRMAASRLAPRLGMETARFKRNVRKLKALGLTLSHDTGYTVTALGARVLRERGLC